MELVAWILIAVAILLTVFLVIYLFSRQKGRCSSPDYKTWFVLGIVWIVLGLPMAVTQNNYGLFAIGIVFAVLGLTHKKEWKNYKKPEWKDLTKKQKTIKIIAAIVCIIALAALVVYFILG